MNQDVPTPTGFNRTEGPGSEGLPGASRFMTAFLIVLILLAGAALRFVYPEADPMPFYCMGTAAWDESWQHEGRNKYLWGEFHQPNDDWRTGLVAAPSNWLTYLSFRCFGMSTESLRLAPRLLGMLTVVLMGVTGWTAWGRRAGLWCMLTSAVALPLVAFSRVAMIEGFLLPASVLLLLLAVLQVKGRRMGILIGLTAALCFAIKASAVLLILPIGVGMLVCAVLERVNGHSWWRSFQRAGIPETLLSGVIGGAMYWFLAIRGDEEAWWYLNVTYCAVGRMAGLGIGELAKTFVKLPTHTEAILVVLAPLGLLAMYQSVQALASLVNRRQQLRSTGNGGWVSVELFLAIVLLVAVVFLLFQSRRGVSGRRATVLVPLVILVAHSVFATGRGNPLRTLSMGGRLAVFVIASPLLWLGLRSMYGLITQGVWASISPRVWYEPLSVLMDRTRLLMDFGPFVVVAGLIVIVWLVKAVSLSPLVVRVCLVATLLLQVFFFMDYAGHRTYTAVTASRELGKLLPPDTVVLGVFANAHTVCWENQIRPIFTTYPNTYSNCDESKVARWRAPYLLVSTHSDEFRVGNDVDWSKLTYHDKARGTSPLYSTYKRIVAIFPICHAGMVEYAPELNPGYYLLLAKQ